MSTRVLLHRKLRRDLRQRRGQAIAVAVTVFLGTLVLILATAVSANLDRSKKLTYERTAFADVWVTGGPPGLADELRGLEGVERVERRTVAEVGVRFADRPIRTRIVGFGAGTTLNRLIVDDGEGLDGHRRGVVIERHTADHFGLGPGDFVSIAGIGVVGVVGVATSPEWLEFVPNNREIVVDPDEFGVLFVPEALAATAAPNTIELVIAVAEHDEAQARAVASAALDGGAADALTAHDHPSERAVQSDVDGFTTLAFMFPLLLLGAAGMATAVLLGRLVVQQKSEIGVLRANGFSKGAIQRHFGGYGIVVALVGAVPAIPFGVLSAWLITGIYTRFVGLPTPSSRLYPITWGIGLVFAAVVGGLSGAVSARAASRVDPATAMRPGGGAVAGKHSALERVLPARSPSWLLMAVRNLRRRRGRAVATGFGVVLALVVTMTALVVNDTNNDMFRTQFTREDQRGLVVTFDGPVDDAATNRVAAVDGVSAVERHLEIGASLVARANNVTEKLQVFAAGTALHNFDMVGGLPRRGMVLSRGAADDLGVGPGDTVEVRALDGTTGVVEVVSVIVEPYAGSSYLSVQSWKALGGPAPRTLAIGLERREDHRLVRDAVARLDGVEQLSDQVAMAGELEGMLSANRAFVGILLVLAVAMAVALVYNALSAAVGERETEVATLQANGVGRAWIRRTITAENLVTVGLALGPGLILGRLVGQAFYGRLSTDEIVFDPILQPRSWLIAAGLVVICAVLAQLPGLRRLDRLDLSTKVRERAL